MYNVGCGGRISLLEVLAQVEQVLGVTVQPTHTGPRAGDVKDSCADIAAARRDLGYEVLVDFEEGLRRDGGLAA
ncbi:MAG: hypothetical protein ABR540_19545 [Acidimicrobiales bacterium]